MERLTETPLIDLATLISSTPAPVALAYLLAIPVAAVLASFCMNLTRSGR